MSYQTPPGGEPPLQSPPPYPPQYQTPHAREDNSLSIASLVLGILSFFCLGIVGSIPAVVLGHIALGRVRRGEISENARGMAMAGLVLGYINIALTVLFIVGYIVLLTLGFGMSQTVVTP